MMRASAIAWLTKDNADASRWLSWSITKEKETRPTTAIAVSSAIATVARSRPIRLITEATIALENPDSSMTLPNTAPSRKTGK